MYFVRPSPKLKPEGNGLDQSSTLNSNSTHPTQPQTFLPVPEYKCRAKSVYNPSTGEEKYYNEKINPPTPQPKPEILYMVFKSPNRLYTEVSRLV
jgi:hypothetical protein